MKTDHLVTDFSGAKSIAYASWMEEAVAWMDEVKLPSKMENLAALDIAYAHRVKGYQKDADSQSPTTLAEVCENIAETLKQRGHIQGGMIDPATGSMCLLGAGRYVQNSRVAMAGYHAVDFITARALMIDNPYDVVSLNDSLGTTTDKVIDLCINAAKHWRNQ